MTAVVQQKKSPLNVCYYLFHPAPSYSEAIEYCFHNIFLIIHINYFKSHFFFKITLVVQQRVDQ